MNDSTDEPSHDVRIGAPTVTAVVVAHDGARWLSTTLSSLAAQRHRPSLVVGMDLDSADDSRAVLVEHLGADAVTSAPAGIGLGAAVDLALADRPPPDWIWILHDDCAADPQALRHLLEEATTADDVGVVGPKIREWPSLRRLLEVGVTLSGTGRRETGLERGEPDQGQHDRPRDVLAVSSAGMLIRRDVWERLGGFDALLPIYGDIDLGWRAARAGYRVRVAPRAVLFHVEASVAQVRPGSRSPRREIRRSALFTLLANASAAGFVWQWGRLLLGSLLRAIGLLLVKAPRVARDEVAAVAVVYGHPLRLLAARRRRAVSASRPAREVRHLLPHPGLPYRHGVDALAEVTSALVRPAPATAGRRTVVETGPVPAEAEDLTTAGPLRRPWLLTVVALVVLSLVAARGLYGAGSLQGGALLPAPDSAAQWWQLFLERSHRVGNGSAAAPPPYVVALAVPATVALGDAGLVVDALLVLAVPLAAVTTHRLARRVVVSPWVQAWWAVAYATVVVASGAVAQGRLGTVVALVVAPATANSAVLLLSRPRLQRGVRTGLWVALGTAFAPMVYPLAALMLVVATAVVRRRGGWVAAVVALLVPWPVLGPWMWTRAVDPTRWWWEAGRADAHVGVLDPSAVSLALGRAGGQGYAPAWLGIGLLLAGVLALLRTDRLPAVLAAWGVALAGLLAAVLGAGITPVGSAPAWVGAPAALWLGGLVAAAAIAADGSRGFLARRRFGLVQPLAVVVTVLAVAAPVATAVWWVGRTVADPLRRGPATDVPAYLAARAEDDGPATLVVRGTRTRGVTYSIHRDDGDRLGDEAVAPDPAASAPFDRVVAGLLSDPTTRVLDELAARRVRAIYLARPADDELAEVLDAAPGLAPSGGPAASRVWTFESDAAPAPDPATGNRPLVAAGQLAAVLLALLVAAPGRRREVAR